MHAATLGTKHRKSLAALAVVAAFALVAVAQGVLAFGGNASSAEVEAMSASTYGGRAYGAWTHVPLVGDSTYGDTGDLPATGGALFGDFSPVDNSVASATVFLTYTRGFLDAGRSEAMTSDVSLVPGNPYEVVASFTYTGATATCNGVSGASEIPDLTVGGVAVPVTGEPNQIYSIPGVLTLVINEQIDRSSGSTYDLEVNALHLTLLTGVEAVVSSARSAVSCGGLGLGLGFGLTAMHIAPKDFMTGGGFFFANGDDTCNGVPFSDDRINFGFNAGPRPGTWPTVKGHLNVVDHGPNCSIRHIQGTDVTFYEPFGDPDNCRRWGADDGSAKVNGASGYNYEVVTCDYGEPGRNDRFAISVWLGTIGSGVLVYHADNGSSVCVPGGCQGDLRGGNIQLHTFG